MNILTLPILLILSGPLFIYITVLAINTGDYAAALVSGGCAVISSSLTLLYLFALCLELIMSNLRRHINYPIAVDQFARAYSAILLKNDIAIEVKGVGASLLIDSSGLPQAVRDNKEIQREMRSKFMRIFKSHFGVTAALVAGLQGIQFTPIQLSAHEIMQALKPT